MRTRPSFPDCAASAKFGHMSRRDAAEERWAIVVANGRRPADMDARVEALVGPDGCRRCGTELPPMPGPRRPRVWCDESGVTHERRGSRGGGRVRDDGPPREPRTAAPLPGLRRQASLPRRAGQAAPVVRRPPSASRAPSNAGGAGGRSARSHAPEARVCRDPAPRPRSRPPVGVHVGPRGAMNIGVASNATERKRAPGWCPGPRVRPWRSTQRGLPISPAALCDPVAECRLADLAAGDAPDHVVGLIRITGRGDPGSAVALDELDRS